MVLAGLFLLASINMVCADDMKQVGTSWEDPYTNTDGSFTIAAVPTGRLMEVKIIVAGCGETDDSCFIKATDAVGTQFADTWMALSATYSKEMLAIALSAIALNCNVLVWIEGTWNGMPLVYNMHLINPN
jgi:hypothetical protein